MFTSLRNDPAWRWAIVSVLVGRVAFSLWAFIIVQLSPFLVTNLTLYGVPVVAAFNQRTSERYAFARQVQGRELHMLAATGALVDAETATMWNMTGEAVSGTLIGNRLDQSPFPLEQIFPYLGVDPATNGLLSPWQRFDTNWYLKIADRGYDPSDGSTVYMPLYPLLIKAVGTILLDEQMLAALIISTFALIGACVFLYRMTADLVGPNAARRTVALLLIFPTAFFLFSGYTESLFLFLSLASLQRGTQGNWFQAGVLGSLASLTRLQGVLLIVPLAYIAWQRRARWDASYLALIPLATAAFFAWQYAIVGNGSLIGVYEGQLHARFVMPWDNVASSLSLLAAGQASLIDGLNLAATVLFGLLIFLIWRASWMPREFTLFALAMYLAPLFRMTSTQPLVSMVRYVLVLFPVFIALGLWTRNAWAERAIVYVSMPFALFLSAQFVMWGWVG